MKKLFFLLIFYTFPCFASIEVPHYSEDSITTLPILYQGRCRPLEAYARSLLHTFYQRDEFLLSHRQFFEKKRPSAVDWLIDLQTHGHSKWDDFPLFYVEGDYLSYNSLPTNLEGELLEKKIFMRAFQTNNFTYFQISKTANGTLLLSKLIKLPIQIVTLRS